MAGALRRKYQKVVEFLAAHTQVDKVTPPSLLDQPDHALHEKYLSNGGASIFTFEIKGGQEEAYRTGLPYRQSRHHIKQRKILPSYPDSSGRCTRGTLSVPLF